MEALLPSEIARLVLGYLEEQNCAEAAKIFLEKSPLLQECNAVAQRGGKFARKVNGITLMDVFDKFCAINILVQEKLSKLEDCEQLKNAGDLVEQLKSLMDGPRGQRFVVNINVPAQNSNQMPGGSPIISSSMRKRRHSGQADKEKFKKPHKSNSPTADRGPEPQPCDAVETTSLDQLPGHQSSEIKTFNAVDTTGQEDEPRVQCSSTVTELPLHRPVQPPTSQQLQLSSNAENRIESSTSLVEKATGTHDGLSTKESDTSNQTCETGTNTQEPMAYTNTEVQTIPCHEIQSQLVDGPVENLSLLTKELLNRTELQERIAQTINRARMPTEASLRESSFSDNPPGECNTSIMRELDNAIKSIVSETETDPIFEKFLLETIGPRGIEGETSPDEDGAHSPKTNDSPSKSSSVSSNQESNPLEVEVLADLIADPDPLNFKNTETQLVKEPDNPASSSANDQVPPDADEEFKSLDHMNAQAVLSIINVNNTTKEIHSEKEHEALGADKSILAQPELQIESIPIIQSEVVIEKILPNKNQPKNNSNINTRRRRSTRPKRERKELTPKKQIPEDELVPIPTLIVCSQEEIESMRLPSVVARPKSQFVPIMPKTSAMALPPEQPLFLRAVNVVRSTKFLQEEKPSTSGALQTNSKNNQNNVNKQPPPVSESITLYGDGEALNGAKAAVVQQANIPSVEVEEPISLSGTGLSPYLKLNRKVSASASNDKDSQTINNSANITLTTTKQNSDMLTKRTPRSIMKSRSRNHRLSLSTPRRRSSHIRALDFSTPTKGLNSSRRLSDADKSASFSPKSSKQLSKACRTSLFKSPPFTGSTSLSPLNKKTIKTPIKLPKDTEKLAIATNCPAAPKLIGGWDKITGVGMIIDGTSSQPSSGKTIVTASSQVNNKKSWDADLRLAVMADVQPVESTATKNNKKDKPLKNGNNVNNNDNNTNNNNNNNDNNSNNNHQKRSLKKHKEGVDETDSAVKVDAAPIDQSTEMANCSPPDPIVEEKKLENPSNDNKSSQQMEVEVTEKLSESMTTTIQNIDGQVVTKKYAKLKTLTTTVTKGHSMTDSKGSDFGNLPELETPRKFDPNFVPPTPRVLSPSNTMTTPFAQLQLNEDSGKVQSFVSTPEFPPTPCINLTPKQQSNDNTIDDTNKKEGYGSKYYQPSSELKENNKINDDKGEQVIGMLSTKAVSCTASTKLEITQFEVIKGNLPKEQAIKELKITKSQIEIQSSSSCNKDPVSVNKSLKSCDSSGTVDDSSGSDSDSSSSSSCSSSSCSTCCDDTNTSSKMSTSRKCKKTPHKADVNSSSNHDLVQESSVPLNNEKINEKSPGKLIPIIKDDKDLKELETPAKDENILPEADISETPSSSKAGVENLTNLNSKITAMIKKDAVSKVEVNNPAKSSMADQQKSKPRIISIQTLVPARGDATIQEGEVQEGESSNKIAIADAKLSRELDEKRLRIINKLKADVPAPKSRITRPKEPTKTTITNKKTTKTTCQPVRKSVRNAEKRAQRGLSEPLERPDTIEKIQVQRKAQSSRESSNNEDGHIENIITSMSTIAQVQVPVPEMVNQITTDAQQMKKIDKGPDKSKVEMIKRDLFSDEENDPTTSNSKNEPANHNVVSQENPNQQQPQSVNNQLLPGVLESLQLVPTNKSFEENSDLDMNSYEHIEISFVYDETVSTKKRRRKISNSELEMKVQTWSESGDIVWQTMTTTNYDEIFNITPPRKRRTKVVTDKPVTTLVARRKGKKAQLKNSKSIVSMIQSQPLATSSPVKDILPKVAEKKAKAIQKTKAATDNKVTKPRKRKHSEPPKEDNKDDPDEKKTRIADPTILLSKINIDKFLNQVHGPES